MERDKKRVHYLLIGKEERPEAGREESGVKEMKKEDGDLRKGTKRGGE